MAAAAVERPGAPPPPQQRYQGVQKESAGYRLLTTMGWREGEGLGASKQGIKSHIKVKKKFENWGVGALEAQHAQNWTNGMLDFHRVLSNLSEVVSEHAKRRSSSSSSSEASSSSDSESGGAPGGSSSSSDEEDSRPPPQQQAAGKKRKAGGGEQAAAGAEAEAAAAPKRVKKAATHIGRFKKREAAKMVKSYSEHDLAAILGGDPFAAAAAAVPEVRAQQRKAASSSGYDSDSEASGSDAEGGSAGRKQRRAGGKAPPAAAASAERAQQQQQQPERPPMIVVRRPMPASCRPPQPPTPQESRQPGWWQVCFHRAAGPGGVGAQAAAAGAKPAAATINVHGFSEQDQTNLYNLAHDKATQGRVGLGRSSMPKKVAGARWAGKKTRIQDSDEEGAGSEGELSAEEAAPLFRRQEGPEVGPAPAGVELEQEEGLVIILPASKRHLLDALPDCSPAPGAAAQLTAAAAPPPAAQQQQQAAEVGGTASGKKAFKKAKKAAAKQQADEAAAAAVAAAAAAQAPAAAEPAAAAGGGDAAVGRIKWKKAVAAVLKASPKGRVKLSKLHKAVVREQGVPKAQRGAALAALTSFLEKSSKFTLADGVVRAKGAAAPSS